jgi:hypothetical protein
MFQVPPKRDALRVRDASRKLLEGTVNRLPSRQVALT